MHPTAIQVEHYYDLARAAAPEALENAALYLHHYGWCQNQSYVPAESAAPAASVVGAIVIAITGHPATSINLRNLPQTIRIVAALASVAQSLNLPEPEHRCGNLPCFIEGLCAAVNTWNDTFPRGVDDVIDTLHAAAANERALLDDAA